MGQNRNIIHYYSNGKSKCGTQSVNLVRYKDFVTCEKCKLLLENENSVKLSFLDIDNLFNRQGSLSTT